MKIQLHQSLRRGLGATTTETVILLVLIAMVAIAMIKLLGGNIGGKVEFANDSVSAVSTENNEMERLRANQRAAEARRGSGGGGSAAEASQSAAPGQPAGAASPASSNDPRERAAASARATTAVAPSGGCGGGFNPFVIPIALGLLGLLGYVVVKSQKG